MKFYRIHFSLSIFLVFQWFGYCHASSNLIDTKEENQTNEGRNTPSKLISLDKEIWFEIARYLDPVSLERLWQSSKKIRNENRAFFFESLWHLSYDQYRTLVLNYKNCNRSIDGFLETAIRMCDFAPEIFSNQLGKLKVIEENHEKGIRETFNQERFKKSKDFVIAYLRNQQNRLEPFLKRYYGYDLVNELLESPYDYLFKVLSAVDAMDLSKMDDCGINDLFDQRHPNIDTYREGQFALRQGDTVFDGIEGRLRKTVIYLDEIISFDFENYLLTQKNNLANLIHNGAADSEDVQTLRYFKEYGFPGHLFTSGLDLRSLHSLSVNECFTRLIPYQISELSTLTHLDLSGNKLSTLPPEISRLGQLKTLNLQNNRFIEFPKTITGITTLKALSLNQNLIRSLPETISNLVDLQTLELSCNHFNRPIDLGRQSTFRHYLILKNIKSFKTKMPIPDEIFTLKNLETIDLSNNFFNCTTQRLLELDKLKQINFYDANILDSSRKYSGYSFSYVDWDNLKSRKENYYFEQSFTQRLDNAHEGEYISFFTK